MFVFRTVCNTCFQNTCLGIKHLFVSRVREVGRYAAGANRQHCRTCRMVDVVISV
jgi:hypothetical protein